jgi:hypothetical protein
MGNITYGDEGERKKYDLQCQLQSKNTYYGYQAPTVIHARRFMLWLIDVDF